MRQRGDATPTTLFAAPPPTSLAAARTPANTAATLLPSCEVPVAGAATGRGGEALSAPRHGPWLSSPLAGGTGLFSPRPRLDGVSSTDQVDGISFTVHPVWF